MSLHDDCVSRADLLRDYIPADVARAECAAEVAGLREALEALVESIDAFLTSERKTDRVMPERMRTAYLRAKAALAEDSDVPDGTKCEACGVWWPERFDLTEHLARWCRGSDVPPTQRDH